MQIDIDTKITISVLRKYIIQHVGLACYWFQFPGVDIW